MKILAMGNSALMDGFSLLGIKTYADESIDTINSVLSDLERHQQRALVFMQHDLINAEIPMVKTIRQSGGSILICEIPNLQEADDYQPAVEKLIGRVLGASALENTNGN